MRGTIRTFKNVRVRFLRHSDGEWRAGWIEDLTPEMAHVRLQGYSAFVPGERFACEAYGDGTLARFEGVCAGQSGLRVALSIPRAMAFEPSRESVRLQAEGISGTVRDGSREAAYVVMDVSPGSTGGIADASFAPGARLSLSLAVGDREFEASVRVANCRAEDSSPGHDRLGLTILETSRLSAAVWKRTLERLAEP